MAASITKKFKKLKKTYRDVRGKIKRGLFRKKKYIGYRDTLPIDEKAILLESQQGGTVGGNIFALMKELCQNPDYAEYKLYLSCFESRLEGRQELLKHHGLDKRVTVVSTGRAEYFKMLATAKYLINDNTFTPMYIKRPGQVYLNTWHGTPLKTLGKKIKKDYAGIGNAQRNFFMSDYLLYPNEFTMQHMLEDYMVENLGQGTVLLAGYPRNSVFLTEGRSAEIRKECGMEHMEVFAYLPTWRGVIGKITSKAQNERLYQYLQELDGKLKDNQRVYVKLHPISVKDIDLSEFKKILPFPADKYETYEFLNATDGLITDYSSVFFDYAVTGKKIILFTYDKEEYTTDRGFYFDMDELPFPQVDTVDGLVRCLNEPKQYDDTEFLKTFCAYEHKDISNALLHRFLFGEKSPLIKEDKVPDNGRKNVVFYAGGFAKNGITTSVLNLLRNIDCEKYNCTVIFRMVDLKSHPESLLELPEGVCHYGYHDARSVNMKDAFLYKLWEDFRILPYKWAHPVIRRRSKNEYDRILGCCRIDKIIHFNGYMSDMIALLEEAPCSRTIFVHNDMDQETQKKRIMNRKLLSHAYQTYDSVAVVTPDLVECTARVAAVLQDKAHTGKANIVLARNIIDYKMVQEQGAKEFQLDYHKTLRNCTLAHLDEILHSDAKKIITVGRFSEEKGHARLMDAFAEVLKDYPDTYLFIVGGYGPLFEKMKKKALDMGLSEHIIIIRYLSNPYPLVKLCDYFALSSFYEGFGLVLAEADILGVPCFSTAITGPTQFMQQYGGLLVENSEKGIVDGLRACLEGKAPKKLSIDYEQYNKEAITQFEALIP